jgi:hypothetical protein
MHSWLQEHHPEWMLLANSGLIRAILEGARKGALNGKDPYDV